MKLPTLILLTTGFILGSYPKFEPMPFDMVSVRFCPQTSNTLENIRELQHKGKKVKIKDFLPQNEAQSILYQDYCKRSNRMLKRIWDEKRYLFDSSAPASAIEVKEYINPRKNLYLVCYTGCAVLIAIASKLEAKAYKSSEKTAFRKIKEIENDILTTASNANRSRDYNIRIDNKAWDELSVSAGLVSVRSMVERYQKQEMFNDEEFKTHIFSLRKEQSQLEKAIAENRRDTARAEKERDKIAGRSKNPTTNSNEGADDELKNALSEALKNHESGWIWDILKMRKPVWIIGGQGSGKSTLAASLVLLRYYLFDWELEEIIDAHGQKNADKAWKVLLEVFSGRVQLTGSRNDWAGINGAMAQAVDRWADKTEDSTPVQSLVDEFTNLADASECSEMAARFVKHSLSDIRKTGERWIFIAHFFTATATGNSRGTDKAKRTQTIQIERFTKDGEKPLNNVSVTGLSDQRGKVVENLDCSIPKWLKPEVIYGHFNGSPIEF